MSDRARRWIPALGLGTLCVHNPWGYTVLPDVPLVLLVVLSSFAVGAGVRSGRLVVDRVAGLLLVAVLAGIGSAMFSAAPVIGLFGGFGRSMGVVTVATWCLAYVAGLTLGSRSNDRDRQLGFLVVGASVFSTLVLMGHWGLALTPEASGSRATGSLGSSAFTGATLAMLMPWGLVEALDVRPGRRVVGYVASISCALALAATGARAAWLGAVVALVTVVVMRWRESGRKVLVGLALGLLVTTGVATKVFDTSERIEMANDPDGTAAGRMVLWGSGFRSADTHLVLGVGMDQQESALALELPNDFEARFGDEVIVDRSHNWILDTWLGGGLMVVGSLVIAATVALWRGRRDALGVAISAGFVGYAVQAQFNFAIPAVETVLWLLLGLNVAPSARTRTPSLRAVAPVVLVGSTLGVPLLLNVVADVRLENGRRAEIAGDVDRALREFEAAATTASWQPVLSEVVARFRLRSAEPSLALDPADEAIRRSGGQVRWKELKGEVLVSMGKFEEAADLYRELVATRGNDSSLYVGLGESLMGAGDLDGARTAFGTALDIDPDSERANEALSLLPNP